MTSKWIIILACASLLAATPAWAQQDNTQSGSSQQGGSQQASGQTSDSQQDNPDDTGSGVITAEQLSDDISVCITKFEGIVVFYILPRGWEGAEQGVNRQTGKLDEDLNRYVLLSKSPMTDDNGVPDLVFELSIYREVLPESWDENLSEDEKSDMEQAAFWDFIDTQMSLNAKAGWHCVTPTDQIKAKPYGTGTRPQTLFVPIFYEREGKVNIYTFTSITAGKVWTMKFLVKSDQADNYGALIALILNNSFAMTEDEFAKYQEEYNEAVPQSPED